MFLYDEDSNSCYFNPHSFETSDQYFLVGALLGLAIYNSTILDIALPPFAFRKLLASAPVGTSNNVTTITRSTWRPTLEDFAELHPSLAHGLRQLLNYDGDVQETFSLDFVVPTNRYGLHSNTPLCPNGESRPVTNANKREYVDAYVRYALDTAVTRQFEPFKRGFFTIASGNALSLFRPEEIELLVRGSDEALDIDAIKAVAVYEGWRLPRFPTSTSSSNGFAPSTFDHASQIPVLQWFWHSFSSASPTDQRKLLLYITGSDRIPATGASNVIMRIQCAGEDPDRLPTARTCFNMLQLPMYRTRDRLEKALWFAVREGGTGFGMK